MTVVALNEQMLLLVGTRQSRNDVRCGCVGNGRPPRTQGKIGSCRFCVRQPHIACRRVEIGKIDPEPIGAWRKVGPPWERILSLAVRVNGDRYVAVNTMGPDRNASERLPC